MIVWPDETRMKPEGRDALRRFRATSAAADLEGSNASWRIVAWPWTDGWPQRIMLENEELAAVSVTSREGEIWIMAEEPRTMQVRTVESLERDALGMPYVPT